ncbi:MAG TPA: histidine kinase [Chitinophagaceae bacterium]|nr:histidine kinase [Chitinophagaceae bacterium]
MANTPLSVTRFRFVFGACWLVLMTDHALILYWLGITWTAAILDSVISNSLLLLFSLLIMNTLRYYLPRREQYLHIFFWCVFLALLWLLLTRWFLDLALTGYPGYPTLLSHSLSIRFSIAFLLLGCVTMISVLWYTWEEQKETEARKADAERLAREAELYKLRQQLQPHFLFNSLNSINALIGSSPQEARKMVQELSDFLRGTLRREENQFISLADELEYLRLYLDIEKVRFGHRLVTDVQTTPEALTHRLPALLLQPLMENAIKFGLYGTTGEARISLRAQATEDQLVVEVTNPYDADMQMPSGTGFGLRSVKRRLYLLFGRSDLVETSQGSRDFSVTVKIPRNHGETAAY